MAKPSKPAAKTAPAAPARTNEFSGLTTDARVELAAERIRSHWRAATHEVLGIGRVLVNACYDGDDKAALHDTSDRNDLLVRVTRALGTIEGGPDKGVLSVARRVVAFAAITRSNFFQLLPYTHKRALVPLTDAKLVAEGAKRAAEFGWTVAQVENWVRGKQREAGKPIQRRGARLGGTRRAVTQLRGASDDKSLERIGSEYLTLDDDDRAALRAEVDEAAASLAKLRRKLAELEKSRPSEDDDEPS